jgi:hypothetical protein
MTQQDTSRSLKGKPSMLGLRGAAVVVTGLGAAAHVAAEVRLSGGSVELLAAFPFVLWGLAPFGLAIIGLWVQPVSTGRAIGLIATSGFGLAMYADLLTASRISSTAGLALLFIPLWQLLACGAVLVVTAVIGRGARAAQQRDEADRARRKR